MAARKIQLLRLEFACSDNISPVSVTAVSLTDEGGNSPNWSLQAPSHSVDLTHYQDGKDTRV